MKQKDNKLNIVATYIMWSTPASGPDPEFSLCLYRYSIVCPSILFSNLMSCVCWRTRQVPAKRCFHDVVSYNKAFPIYIHPTKQWPAQAQSQSVQFAWYKTDLIVALSGNRDGLSYQLCKSRNKKYFNFTHTLEVLPQKQSQELE